MNDDAGGERPWFEQPAGRMDLDLDQNPYPFHRRRRDPIAASATVEFTEMLCQIDRRFDALLPQDWPLEGYLFALMDALRAEYVSAYTRHHETRTTTKGTFLLSVAPNPSRAQVIFWQDEDSTYRLISAYLDSAPARQDGPADYTRQAVERRRRASALGLVPAEYYPFPPSRQSQDDADPLDDQPEDDGAGLQGFAPGSGGHMPGPAGPGPSMDGGETAGPIDWEGEDDEAGS